MPQLYMIGGPNGAGKTTAAMHLLPELLMCEEYVNADAIAEKKFGDSMTIANQEIWDKFRGHP